MRVVIPTIGSRGDLEPALALAIVLRRRGHDVRVIGPRVHRARFDSRRVAYLPLLDQPSEGLVADRRSSVRESLADIRGARDGLIEQFDTVLRAAEWADTLVAPLGFSPVAISLFEQRGMPVCVYSLTPPFVPTREFMNPWLPAAGRIVVRSVGYRLFEEALWQPARRAVNRWRRERMGLPDLPRFGYFRHLTRLPIPRLLAVSPVLFPRASSWPEHVQVTGNWFVSEPARPPDPEVIDFVERGTPPLCVTLGSNVVADPFRAEKILVEALRRTRHRALVVGGDGVFNSGRRWGADVLTVEQVSYEWLLPRVAAMVHHAGAGTTACALRHGLPSVVIPGRMDQWAFARRLHAMGVASSPVSLCRLTPAKLARRIAEVDGDPRIAAEVRKVKVLCAAERGADVAGVIVERHAEGVLRSRSTVLDPGGAAREAAR